MQTSEPSMNVNVILITHDEIGNAILSAATNTLGELPLPATVVSVAQNTDPEDLIPRLINITECFGKDCGILVLTDIYGSTPSNIAQQLHNNHNIRIVSGLNLPMLIRVMNYPTLSLNELAEKAFSGGRDGVINCEGCETC